MSWISELKSELPSCRARLTECHRSTSSEKLLQKVPLKVDNVLFDTFFLVGAISPCLPADLLEAKCHKNKTIAANNSLENFSKNDFNDSSQRSSLFIISCRRSLRKVDVSLVFKWKTVQHNSHALSLKCSNLKQTKRGPA